MDEIDLKDVPFADWLEEAIPALCRMDVKCIGMAAILKDGGVATNFWEADTNDMAAMGYRFMEEGVLNTLRANGRELKEIIDNAELEEKDEGKEDDDGI